MSTIYGRRIPERFYKYRSLADKSQQSWLKQTILENRFYWATPDNFNDPFDCAPILRPLAGRELALHVRQIVRRLHPDLNRRSRLEQERKLLRRSEKDYTEGRELARAEMRRTSIYSLAEARDDVLMWSHYADSHRGICFEFDARVLHQHFTPGGILGLPVTYQRERPIIKVSVEEPRELLRKTFLVKADWWAYEKEWRFLEYLGGGGLREFPANALTGITLGALVGEEKERFIRDTLKQRQMPVEVTRASFDENEFRLNIAPA